MSANLENSAVATGLEMVSFHSNPKEGQCQKTLKTCLLRNIYAGQEATVRIGRGTTDWFQIRKRVCQGCILSLCLLNLYAEYIMRHAGLDEAQSGIKIAGRHINNLRYADDITKSERRTKEPLDESKRGE